MSIDKPKGLCQEEAAGMGRFDRERMLPTASSNAVLSFWNG